MLAGRRDSLNRHRRREPILYAFIVVVVGWVEEHGSDSNPK